MAKLDDISANQLENLDLRWPKHGDSWVWDHFALLPPVPPAPDSTHCVCLYCGHVKESTGNTTNQAKHLLDKHKLRDVKSLTKKRARDGQTQLLFRSTALTASQTKNLHNALALFIAGDGRAPNLITGKWFQNFLKVRALHALLVLPLF
jgi:hypothetical protein